MAVANTARIAPLAGALGILLSVLLLLSLSSGIHAGDNNSSTALASTPHQQQQQEESLETLSTRAETGDSGAQFDLGSRYLYGEGVTQSNFDALHWFRLAAAQQNHNAQYNLAVMYLNGIGVVANTGQALDWFEAAANNGDGMAQYNLGVFHANGVYGLAQDIQRAWMWFTLAGSAGLDNAESNALLLQEFLTVDQLLQAQEMARQQILRIQER